MERYREPFRFLRENGIQSTEQFAAYKIGTEKRLAVPPSSILFSMSEEETPGAVRCTGGHGGSATVKELYASGMTDIEDEFAGICTLPMSLITAGKACRGQG